MKNNSKKYFQNSLWLLVCLLSADLIVRGAEIEYIPEVVEVTSGSEEYVTDDFNTVPVDSSVYETETTDTSSSTDETEITEAEDEESEVEGHFHEHEEPEDEEIALEFDDVETETDLTDISFEQRLLAIIDGETGDFYSFVKNLKTSTAVDVVAMNSALDEYQAKIKNLYTNRTDSSSQATIKEIHENIASAETSYKTTLKSLINDDFIWLMQLDLIKNNGSYSEQINALQQSYKSFYGFSTIVSLYFDSMGYTDQQIAALYSLFDLCNQIVQTVTAAQAYPVILYTHAIVSGIAVLNL
jgi:hypothetical protein